MRVRGRPLPPALRVTSFCAATRCVAVAAAARTTEAAIAEEAAVLAAAEAEAAAAEEAAAAAAYADVEGDLTRQFCARRAELEGVAGAAAAAFAARIAALRSENE